jgi:hypothetical protein
VYEGRILSPFNIDPSYPKVAEVIMLQPTSSTAIDTDELGTRSEVLNGKMAPENVCILERVKKHWRNCHP